MPDAPLHYCSGQNGRCPNKVSHGKCPTCQQQHNTVKHTAYDQTRGTRHQRGYGFRWEKQYRPWFLSQYPLCGDRPPGAPMTMDSTCQAQGRVTAATVVDHIKPVTGPTDQTFFQPTAHQALCEVCHNQKRSRESRGGGK